MEVSIPLGGGAAQKHPKGSDHLAILLAVGDLPLHGAR
jgi:hypothetical protein